MKINDLLIGWGVSRQLSISATFSPWIAVWIEGVSFMEILDGEQYESWYKDISADSIYRLSFIMVWDNKGYIVP